MLVAVGVLGLLGIVFFEVLNSGIVLYAKNTAVNVAHEEAREGIARLLRDTHAAISVPQLAKDTSVYPNNVTSSTPSGSTAPMAAGICFQNVMLGPQFVWKDPGQSGLIMVKDGFPKPKEGMSILFPLFGVETDVIKVAASGSPNHTNVWMKNAEEVTLANKTPPFGSTGGPYSICYYTYRTMYLVKSGSYIPDSNGPFTLTTGTYSTGAMERYVLQNGSYVPSATGTITITPTTWTSGTGQRYRYENGELHFYKQDYAGSVFLWKDYGAVARYISSPRPFYIPLTADSSGAWYESTSPYLSYSTSSANSTGNRFNGSANTKYVGVKLSARDPSSSNRGYLSTASLLNTQIDYRSLIATDP